jgi:hypothetical protein
LQVFAQADSSHIHKNQKTIAQKPKNTVIRRLPPKGIKLRTPIIRRDSLTPKPKGIFRKLLSKVVKPKVPVIRRDSLTPKPKNTVRRLPPKVIKLRTPIIRRDSLVHKPKRTVRRLPPNEMEQRTLVIRGDTLVEKPTSFVIRSLPPKVIKKRIPIIRRDSTVQNPKSTVIRSLPAIMVKPKIPIIRRDLIAINDSLKHSLAVKDSVYKKDSLIKALSVNSIKRDSIKRDSVKKVMAKAISEKKQRDSATYYAIMPIPYVPFNKPPLFMVIREKVGQSKDEIFYLLCGLAFLVALVRLVFPKYFNGLFLMLFQTSFRQRQTKEQMAQDHLPSLLLNLVFIASGGIYFEFILMRYGLDQFSFWWLLLYSTSILSIIYLGKFLFLIFSGWIFNEKTAANTYIFVVFLVNKVIGIALIPFLLIMAFSSDDIVQIAVVVSIFVVGILFFYRYLVSLGTFHREFKVSALHFFLYLCAVEILPLLLIYKALFNYIGNTI